jgi:predicted nucleic acid-binding protein
MKRLFLDTNIVIDLLDKRMPFCEDAATLFAEAYHKRVQLIISPTTYATASYLLGRHNSFEEVHNLLANLRQLTRVSTEDERVVDDAIASKFADFEDALQYYTAIRAKADIIITRNGKDFSASRIPVMTAAEYLDYERE